MIVIIEGLDGVGKTYLSTLFAQKFNYKYIKESYTSSKEEKIARILNLNKRLSSKDNYIYDRCTLIDDFVYSFLNESKSDLNEYKEEIKYLLNKCIIFHLIVDEKIRKERFNTRGDEYIKNDMIKNIETNYMKYYTTLYNEIHLLPLSNNIDNDINKIKNIVNKYENITHS